MADLEGECGTLGPAAPGQLNAPLTMVHVEQFGWEAKVSFTCFGARFGIRVNGPGVLTRLAEHLPPGSRPSRSAQVDVLYSIQLGGNAPSEEGGFHRLYEGDECIQE